MMTRLPLVLLVLFVGAACASPAPPPVGYKVEMASSYTVVKTYNGSTLYTVDGDFGYDWPVYVADLHGSRYEMGYAYGTLLTQEITSVANAFLSNLISKSALVQDAVKAFCGWQWDDYLSKYLPPEFEAELAGIKQAGIDNGAEDTGDLITMMITLANFPGTTTDILYILEKEIMHVRSAARRALLRAGAEALVEAGFKGFGCSMAGVWGDRTANGEVYSFRNLDWNPNTGAAKAKLITVWHPEAEPGNPAPYTHASFGFAGLYGAMAGVNEVGLSSHEANLEEGSDITFDGFPWVLRMRYILEQCKLASETVALMVPKKDNPLTWNTVGFNHGFFSAASANVDGEEAGYVFETNANFTAVFTANSPVEAAAKIEYNGTMVQYGFPLTDAVYRTNNCFNPETRAEFSWSQSLTSNSEKRYLIIYNLIKAYGDANTPIGVDEMIYINAVLGQKGPQEPAGNPYLCPNGWNGPTPKGTNILSVMCALSGVDGVGAGNTPVAYVAWGNHDTPSTWSSAACNTYIGFDMAKFFSTS